MTKLQNKQNEPIMGRADVLFKFLQMIDKDRPSDIDLYIEQLDVKNDDRPVTDQIVDLIISGDKTLYEKYEQARSEAGSRNPYEVGKNQPNKGELNRAIGSFISKWVAFETAIRDISQANQTIFNAPLPILLQKTNAISQSDFKNADYVRRFRNDLIHGIKQPQQEYIEEAIEIIEKLLNDVYPKTSNSTQSLIDKVLQK